MKDTTEHLGVLALGYLWNHPVQQLNDLFGAIHPENMSPDLISVLRKLTVREKAVLKQAITAIFAKDMTDFCTALDDTASHGEVLEIKESGNRFSSHLPPWSDRLSYFDIKGNPKAEYLR